MKIVYRGDAPEIEVFGVGVYRAGEAVVVPSATGEKLLRISGFFLVHEADHRKEKKGGVKDE